MREFIEQVRTLLKKELGEEAEVLIPPDRNLGDAAFACFGLAKKQKKNPNQIAQDLSKKLAPHGLIKRIESNGSYVNFFCDMQKLAAKILPEIMSKNELYGRGTIKEETVMVEFFQANTHKAMHVGHARNMCLGISIANLLEFCGYKVVRANYQGDIGPHVVKCLWGMQRYNEKPPAKNRLRWLGEIYSKANKEIQGNEELEQEIRAMTKKLYEKEKNLTALWKKTRKWCLADFEKTYQEFNVKFDHLFFESEAEPKGKEMVEKLKNQGIATESQGALVIDLEKHDLGIYLLLRNDGVALYSTKDLALAQEKFDSYKVDRSLYVVGSEQELYFRQLFKTLEIMGFKQAKKCIHISYGLVMLPEGKMSSREGNVVLYDDLRDRLYESAEKGITERHRDWKKKKVEDTKKMLAFSGLKFSMLQKEPNKSIVFDWEKALDFEGETGPYVQYVHARICSIFKKYKAGPPENADCGLLQHEIEEKIISILARFEDAAQDAGEHYRPHVMARYLLDLGQAFNEFYHECPVLQAEENLMKSRLILSASVAQVIKIGLLLLGIVAPEAM